MEDFIKLSAKTIARTDQFTTRVKDSVRALDTAQRLKIVFAARRLAGKVEDDLFCKAIMDEVESSVVDVDAFIGDLVEYALIRMYEDTEDAV